MISGAAVGIGAGTVVAGGDLGTGGGSVGPVTDATITAIDASGWQVTSSDPAASIGKSVVFQPPGYDGTGNVITLPAVSISVRARLRQPAPNHNSLTTSTCYLAEAVCASDIIVGSAAKNTLEDYPLCIAQWASGDRYVVGNTVTVYLTAFHYYGIAVIVGTASDGSNTATALTATQIVLPGNDANKIVGYALTFDVSAFTDKLNFTVNARVCPRRGGSASVLDSSVSTAITGSATSRNFGPRSFRKDVTLAANPIYAYVSLTGNDGTGVVSTTAATALASPFATVDGARVALKNSTLSGKAANSDDGCVIRLMAGSHALNSLTTFTNGATSALIIEAAPGETPSTVTLTSSATAPSMRTQWIRFRNIRLARGGAGFVLGLNGGTDAKAFTEDCAHNNGAQATTMFGAHVVSISGGTATNGASGTALFQASTGAKYEMIRGVTFATPAGAQFTVDMFNVIGCTGNGVALSNNTNSADNIIVAFNRWLKSTATVFGFGAAGPTTISGVAHVQNVYEWTGAGASALGYIFRPSGDSDNQSISNFLHVYNTFAGMDLHGRENAFYDESTGTTRRTHKWILDKFNGKVSSNTKTDRFVNTRDAPGDAVNRTGGWWHAFGVGAEGNHHRYRNAGGGTLYFGPEDLGLGTVAPTTNTPPGDNPLFVNYQGVTGTSASPVAGAGGGDYHVTAGSPYIGKVPAGKRWLDLDLDGATRKNDGTGVCGAYEYAA